uniref:Uncharacterized protein n=1 Tax=Solanum tuberosum TaxID=4113 RepID=M1ADG2_SOLTU
MIRNGNVNNLPMDICFISVTGGIRTLEEQTLLLKQVEKVAKKFNARFVINISELGEDDPLMQNPSSTCRYSTRALKGQGVNHYLKQFKFAHGSLDIIVVDTGLYEVASNGAGDRQSQWLIDTLENSESKWCIAMGLHPLVAYEEDTPQTKLKHEFQSLHGVFLKYGVRFTYLSDKQDIIYYKLSIRKKGNDRKLSKLVY